MLQKDSTDSRNRTASVQVQIILGLGILLALMLIIAAISYIGFTNVQAENEKAWNTTSRVRDLSAQTEIAFFQARQNEADFFNKWRNVGIDTAVETSAAQNQANLAQARAQLDELEKIVQNSDNPGLRPLLAETAALRPLLDSYEEAFLLSVDLTEQRSRSEGLETSMKNRLDFLEFYARENGLIELYLVILQIRANERSYLNTAEQQYADNFRLLSNNFKRTAQELSPDDLALINDEGEASTLVEEFDMYAANFQELVNLEESIKINTRLFNAVTEDILLITENIRSLTQQNVQATRQRLNAISQRNLSLLIITAIVTIIIGIGTAFFLTRRIVQPLRSLSEAATNIGQGDWDQQVRITGGAELVSLGNAFNFMASQLKSLFESLEEKVADRTRALEASMKVSRSVSTILDQQQLVVEVVEQVRNAFDYYQAQIYLLAKDGKTLVMAAGSGKAGEQMLADGHQLEVGQGLVGRAAEINIAVVVPDTSKAADWLPNPLLPDTKSETAVPIAIGDNVLGVLDVQHNVVNGLQQEDADLLLSVANQIAVAIRNSRLYQETQQQAQREALLRNINEKISSTTDMESAMKVAVRELGSALKTNQTMVRLGQQTPKNGS